MSGGFSYVQLSEGRCRAEICGDVNFRSRLWHCKGQAVRAWWLTGIHVTHRDAGDSPGCMWLTGMQVTHWDAGGSQGCRWLTGMQVTHRDACDSQRCRWLIGMQVTHRDAGDSPGCMWLTGMRVTHWDAGDSQGCRWLTGMQVTHSAMRGSYWARFELMTTDSGVDREWSLPEYDAVTLGVFPDLSMVPHTFKRHPAPVQRHNILHGVTWVFSICWSLPLSK